MARLTLQETMDRLLLLIRAGYPVIYIVSHEETRVLDYLAKIIRIIKAENPNKHLLRWYEGTGLEQFTNLSPDKTGEPIKWLDIDGISIVEGWISRGAQQASEALNAIRTANNTNNPVFGDSLTVFFDIHPYIQQNANYSLVRPLRNAADALRRYYDENRNQPGKPYKTIVIIAPSASTLSMELERDLIVLDFPLPETDELKLTLANMLPEPVTIFEGLHAPGGVLRYGIPEFRLPNEILDWEIDLLRDLGVEIVCNVVVGKTIQMDDLFYKICYSAVFIGTGAGLPKFLGIPGENLNGVYSANEFLTRINLMQAYNFPETDTPLYVGKRVAVIGAGNTAMDAIRSALRVGAEEGMSIYRRSEKEMTARVEEYHHAIEEGVKFHWLTNPVEILGNDEGRVTGVKCVRMELGQPDESGRARPVPIEGSEFVIPLDNIVLSLGNSPNPLLVNSTPGLEKNKHGCLVMEEDKPQTSRKWVYAGGDAVTGAATVILAAGAGKDAAAAIHEDLLAVA